MWVLICHSCHLQQFHQVISMVLCIKEYIDGLVQERRNSVANALGLHFSCINPSIYVLKTNDKLCCRPLSVSDKCHENSPVLTNLSLGKMAAISQTIFSDAFSWMKSFEFQKQNPLVCVPKGPIENYPALVQIVVWRWICDKPLYEACSNDPLTHIWAPG